MPINQSLMASLRKQYGVKKGTETYYKMESEGGKSFKKGLATVQARTKKKGVK